MTIFWIYILVDSFYIIYCSITEKGVVVLTLWICIWGVLISGQDTEYPEDVHSFP
jgi:hypothetical protein